MQNSNRKPIETLADLRSLDYDEVSEGYLDGLKNEPCGHNRSRSFWHGWKNGRVDAGHAKKDTSQAKLAQQFHELYREEANKSKQL